MGKLLVLEGIDGSGTSTQVGLLKNFLEEKNFKVITSAEPTDSAFGREIRAMLAQDIKKEQNLLTSLALGFAADRMQHVHNIIQPGLKNYDFVILDRYVLSSYVYQGINLPIQFVKNINFYALKPDLVIILDVSVDIALKRLNKRSTTKDFYEEKELLELVRNRYSDFAEYYTSNSVLIDASGSIEKVSCSIVNIVEDCVSKWK